jgi:uncharacterized protein (TIGR03435 family)
VRMLLLTTAILIGAAQALAQNGAPPAFDVASVKRNTTGPGGPANTQVLPNGINFVNLPLRAIIQIAFQVQQPQRVVNGPSWLESERFDIVARTAAAVPSGDLRGLLQALLAERFKLVTRKEMRPLSAYVLLRADDSTRERPSWKPFTGECATPPGQASAPAAAGAVQCGPRTGGPGRLLLVGVPMQQLAGLLTLVLGQPVIDKTELPGRYDIDLTFVPERPQPGVELAPELANRPSLFTAVQEQLGLRLVSQQQPLEVLVVEHVEQPSTD